MAWVADFIKYPRNPQVRVIAPLAASFALYPRPLAAPTHGFGARRSDRRPRAEPSRRLRVAGPFHEIPDPECLPAPRVSSPVLGKGPGDSAAITMNKGSSTLKKAIDAALRSLLREISDLARRQGRPDGPRHCHWTSRCPPRRPGPRGPVGPGWWRMVQQVPTRSSPPRPREYAATHAVKTEHVRAKFNSGPTHGHPRDGASPQHHNQRTLRKRQCGFAESLCDGRRPESCS